MDEKDRVLKTLLDEDKNQGNFFSLHYTLEKAHPDLDRESILRILERFESQRLISLSAKRIKGTPAGINPGLALSCSTMASTPAPNASIAFNPCRPASIS